LVPPLRVERRKLFLLREMTLPICLPGHLVEGRGIEPRSYALQAYAEITRLAHLPITYSIVLFQQ